MHVPYALTEWKMNELPQLCGAAPASRLLVETKRWITRKTAFIHGVDRRQ